MGGLHPPTSLRILLHSPAIRVRGIVLHARKVAQRCSLGWKVREGRVANDGVVGVLSLGVTRDELGDVPDGRELRELSGYVGVVVRGTFLRGVKHLPLGCQA